MIKKKITIFGLILSIFVILELVFYNMRDYESREQKSHFNAKNSHINIIDSKENIEEEKMDISAKMIDANMESVLSKFPDFRKILKYDTIIKVPTDDGMISQGITKIKNEYIIITAYNGYNKIENSKCFVYDKRGNLINIAILDTNSHVGSIIYDDAYNLLWIPANNGNLNAYEVSDIIKEKNVSCKYNFNGIGSGLKDYADNTKDSIDYLTRDDKFIYVGNFSLAKNGVVREYEIMNDDSTIKLVLVNQFKVPEKIQGITFYKDNDMKYMILSQ